MPFTINQPLIQNVLSWGYDKALQHTGLSDSAYELADEYLQKHESPQEAAQHLVKWQTFNCATSGFITGCGGLLTIPVSLPANIASVLFMQLRLIAAIAIMGGYDPKSDNVQSLAYACLVGNAASQVLKEAGIKVGERVTIRAIESIGGKVLTRINERVGFRLVSRLGKTGIINLGKAIPIAGGLVGGTIDAASTRVIGKTAMKVFLPPAN